MPRSARLEDGIALTLDEFRLLRDLFAAKTGLSFGPEARFALERRLRDRLVVLKLASFTEYHHYLQFGVNAGAEWDEAVDLLTTNETYFFRDPQHYRWLGDEFLPELSRRAALRQHPRRLRLWSAACSTGEEPYSMAIEVLEKRPVFAGWDIRILGTDISGAALAEARA
ncbi:MAG: protein-glutamate O-methyltransferase CheR, partial [Polyangiaceae bacterium]|nr:protein-glutamate O-methyltransferase CheR [Polyangiaceae bacterium]